MNYFLFASLVVISISSIFAITRQLQMLQQNSYFPSRYSKWVKDSFAINLAIEAIFFCVSTLLYRNDKYLPQLIFIVLVLIYRVVNAILLQKKSIKRLVFTGRIKRMYSAAILVFALLIVLFALKLSSLTSEISVILIFTLSFISPIITLLVWTITLPIEKTFALFYTLDAKRILKQHNNLTVIGITGSYGKTTTKFILNRILSEKFNVVCTPQSFNTPMGVVRTIRESIKPQTQIFIAEMGAKNVGDIKEICDIVNPKHAIITSVGPQHLETFKSVDNVFKTKFELANAVETNGGVTFINGDCKDITDRAEKRKYKTFGLKKKFRFRAENITYGRQGSTFDLILGPEKISVTTRLLGKHSVNDIVAASALAYTLGVSINDIKFAISALKPYEHRLELKPFKNSSLMIDDAYNANPVGSLEAIRVLASFENMKKTIITPGLIELGDKEYECNFALGVEAAKYCDTIILVGENRSKPIREGVESTKFDKKNLYVVPSFNKALEIYLKTVSKNSIVLLENDLPDNYLY